MARVSTYLNFPRTTEAAFLFYQAVFGSTRRAQLLLRRVTVIVAEPDFPPT
jgi:hypothetical protein